MLKRKLQEKSRRDESVKQTQPEDRMKVFKNKQKVLLLSTRGILQRQRHFMQDLLTLLPHAKKESKYDDKHDLSGINELAELNGCNNSLFFEARGFEDFFMWMSKCPHGPSARFLVQNVHTMDEMKLIGNHLKGSRPLLSFDAAFDGSPHWQIVKGLITHIFGTPHRHPKSKPFFDHVFTFSLINEKIWFRNYQIVESTLSTDTEKQARRINTDDGSLKLLEVGPRFVLSLSRIFGGSFGGPTLYTNPHFVAPAVTRRLFASKKSARYQQRGRAISEKKQRTEHQQDKVDEVLQDTIAVENMFVDASKKK